MNYTIHTLGQDLELVENRLEANWTLGSRYGAIVCNRGIKIGAIVYSEECVKINPRSISQIQEDIRQEKLSAG